MQFSEVPERLFSSQTAVRVLRVLATHPDKPMTGREIARLAAAPPPRVNERLKALENEGLVSRRTVGPSHLWSLERNHFLVRPLQALFAVDRQAHRELRAALSKWIDGMPGVLEARLFGSMARGDEDPASDVDLFLLVRNRAAKTAVRAGELRVGKEIQDRFGNHLHVITVTEKELKHRPRRAFLGPARKEGELLAGAAARGDRK